MKLKPWNRSLILLCRRMRAATWQLDSNGGIRIPKQGDRPEHCPLSFAGNARDIYEYRAGGRSLGFTDPQCAELARVADSGDWVLPYYRKLRRIMLKAARLEELK